MKRLAAVIISIVFIFTACGRHALESKVFSTAETGTEPFETKETGNEVFETEEREQARNEKSSWTTGSIIKWGFTGYVTLYVVAAASIIIYINYYNKKAYPEGISQGGQKGQVIEKTYKILARIKPNIELTVREILDKLRSKVVGSWLGSSIKGIPFDLKINYVTSTDSLGSENKRYLLELACDRSMPGIRIRDLDRFFNWCVVLARIKDGIYTGTGIDRTLIDGEIVPNLPVELTRIKAKYIETLEITSDDQEDTELLRKSIIPEKQELVIKKRYKIIAELMPETELTVQEILDRSEVSVAVLVSGSIFRVKGIPFNVEINNTVPTDRLGRVNKGFYLYLGDSRIHIIDKDKTWSGALAKIEGDRIIPGLYPYRAT